MYRVHLAMSGIQSTHNLSGDGHTRGGMYFLVEETGIFRENHQPVTDIMYRVHLAMSGIQSTHNLSGDTILSTMTPCTNRYKTLTTYSICVV